MALGKKPSRNATQDQTDTSLRRKTKIFAPIHRTMPQLDGDQSDLSHHSPTLERSLTGGLQRTSLVTSGSLGGPRLGQNPNSLLQRRSSLPTHQRSTHQRSTHQRSTHQYSTHSILRSTLQPTSTSQPVIHRTLDQTRQGLSDDIGDDLRVKLAESLLIALDSYQRSVQGQLGLVDDRLYYVITEVDAYIARLKRRQLEPHAAVVTLRRDAYVEYRKQAGFDSRIAKLDQANLDILAGTSARLFFDHAPYKDIENILRAFERYQRMSPPEPQLELESSQDDAPTSSQTHQRRHRALLALQRGLSIISSRAAANMGAAYTTVTRNVEQARLALVDITTTELDQLNTLDLFRGTGISSLGFFQYIPIQTAEKLTRLFEQYHEAQQDTRNPHGKMLPILGQIKQEMATAGARAGATSPSFQHVQNNVAQQHAAIAILHRTQTLKDMDSFRGDSRFQALHDRVDYNKFVEWMRKVGGVASLGGYGANTRYNMKTSGKSALTAAPILNVSRLGANRKNAGRQKSEVRTSQELGKRLDIPVLEFMGQFLDPYHSVKKSKSKVMLAVGVVTSALSVILPGADVVAVSGGSGMISFLVDAVGETAAQELLAVSLTSWIEGLPDYAIGQLLDSVGYSSLPGLFAAIRGAHAQITNDKKRGKIRSDEDKNLQAQSARTNITPIGITELTDYFSSYQNTMETYMNDISNVRALILYLGLPPNEELLSLAPTHHMHRREQARLRMKEELGSGREDNVFTKALTPREREVHKQMRTDEDMASTFGGTDEARGTNYLHMLWALEGFILKEQLSGYEIDQESIDYANRSRRKGALPYIEDLPVRIPKVPERQAPLRPIPRAPDRPGKPQPVFNPKREYYPHTNTTPRKQKKPRFLSGPKRTPKTSTSLTPPLPEHYPQYPRQRIHHNQHTPDDEATVSLLTSGSSQEQRDDEYSLQMMFSQYRHGGMDWSL
ncbi:MAG: hypothetical protein AAF639_46155 [Chloroflexota bacterium]